MKKHKDKETTPLRFHNFFKNVVLPLNLVYYSMLIIMAIHRLVTHGIESFGILLIIDYAIIVIAIVLMVVAIRGLPKWKYSAWKCTVGLFAMMLTYNIIFLSILTVLNLSCDGKIIAKALRSIIISPCILVYYYKRKELFDVGKGKTSREIRRGSENGIVRNADGVVARDKTTEIQKKDYSTFKKIKEDKVKKNMQIRFCKMCGNKIDSETKRCSACGKQYFKGIKVNKYICVTLILSILIITSVVFNFVQIVEMNRFNDYKKYYENKMLEQQKQILNLNKKIKEKENFLVFYEKYVVFVNDDKAKKYHKYGCDDLDTSSFWAYNTEAAKGKGYSPCSKCNTEKSATPKTFAEYTKSRKSDAMN